MAHGFHGYLTKIKIDKGRFTKALDAQAKKLLINAAREWLREAYVRVPVWSGMARGSLAWAKGRGGFASGQYLSQLLNLNIPIDNIVHETDKKNQWRGGALSRFTMSKDGEGRYNFFYSTNVIHYIINEFYPGSPPSYTRPWKSFEAGKAAFDSYLNQNRSSLLPKASDYIVRSRVRCGD